jgi:hypothetical protein
MSYWLTCLGNIPLGFIHFRSGLGDNFSDGIGHVINFEKLGDVEFARANVF